MENNTFCPFVNGTCKSNCMFHAKSMIATPNGITSCLIAAKLEEINEYQHDDLNDIRRAIEEKQ